MITLPSPMIVAALAAMSGAVVSCTVSAPVAYYAGKRAGDELGYARFAAEQSVADLKAEKARKEFDAKIQNMSDYDFCIDALTRRGLPIDACEELRGIPVE